MVVVWGGGATRMLTSNPKFIIISTALTDGPQYHYDCCGFKYDQVNPHLKVWHCTCCDEFSVCKKCKQRGMHAKYFVRLKIN